MIAWVLKIGGLGSAITLVVGVVYWGAALDAKADSTLVVAQSNTEAITELAKGTEKIQKWIEAKDTIEVARWRTIYELCLTDQMDQNNEQCKLARVKFSPPVLP